LGGNVRRAHRPRAKHVVARPLHALLQANHVHRQPRHPAPAFDLDDDDDAVSSVQAPNFGTGGDRRQSVSELPLGARDALRCPEMP